MTGRIYDIPQPRPGGGRLAMTVERTATVAELHELVIAARPEILAAGARTAQRMELFHELQAILAELSLDAPDLAPVRQRWKGVRHMLGPVAGSGRIAQVTETLIALFPSPPFPSSPPDDRPGGVRRGGPDAGPPHRS